MILLDFITHKNGLDELLKLELIGFLAGMSVCCQMGIRVSPLYQQARQYSAMWVF